MFLWDAPHKYVTKWKWSFPVHITAGAPSTVVRVRSEQPAEGGAAASDIYNIIIEIDSSCARLFFFFFLSCESVISVF